MSNTIYCTYLTTYSGDKLPPLYIGSTSVQKIEEGYHGSVSSKKYKQIWESELKENPHLFETQILTTHETREEALEEEMRLQELHDVVNSDLYINMALANKKFIFNDYNDPEWIKNNSEAQRKPETVKKKSEITKKYFELEENRKKASSAQKKRFDSEEQRKKHSEATKKGMTEEVRKNLSESMKGKKRKPFTEDHRKKMSESRKGKKRGPYKKK